MATKKQKRAAAQAKREKFMADYWAAGEAALKAQKERQAQKDAETQEQVRLAQLQLHNDLAPAFSG